MLEYIIGSLLYNKIYNLITSPIIKYFFYIIIMLILYIFIRKRIKNSYFNTITRYSIHNDEVIKGGILHNSFEHGMNSASNTYYLFWTGGFDSTFILCYYLIIKKVCIRPIYIMCQNLDSKFGLIGRKNQTHELLTMKKIRYYILNKYPHLKYNFLPTFYVYNIQKMNWVTNKFISLHHKSGYFSRDISQYERIARFSIDFDQPIMIGVEKCGTGLDEATQNSLNGLWENRAIIPEEYLTEKNKNLIIFKNLRFPIIHMTKQQMKYFSLQSNTYFYDILQHTWSCWFPTNEGKPCGKCNMCQNRVI